MIKKTALVVGATGLVGKELLDLLLKANVYEKVKVLTRNRMNLDHSKLEQIIVDFDLLDNYKNHLHVNDIFCCLGTTIKKAGSQEAFRKVDYDYPLKLAKYARDQGVDKFIIITAMGANKQSKIFYNRVKGEIEGQLKMLDIPSVLIFRPSLLLGKRKEFRLGEKIATVLSPLFSFALVGSLQQYRPIPAEDVALAMYLTAQKNIKGYHIITSDQIVEISLNVK